MLACFDVVLVVVRPVEVRLLAVVRDVVLRVLRGDTALGVEVSVLVVPREEPIQVVENTGLRLFSDSDVFPSLPEVLVLLKVFLSEVRVLVLQRFIGVEDIVVPVLAQFCGFLFKFFLNLGALRVSQRFETLVDSIKEIFFDELLNTVSPLVQYAVDTKVEIGSVELEEIP